MPDAGARLSYCLANVAAVLAGLYVAFELDLDRPYWTMFTVFVVSKPISGAVRAKGIYRFVGTLLGASMAVFLVPPLVQSPLLLSLAVSVWVGLCLFAALQDRTPRSYTFLLAGYSVAIVALSAVSAPLSIFDVAVTRLEEISIGIICAAVAHSVFFPRNLGDVMREKAEAAIAQAARIAARAVGSDPVQPSMAETAAVATAVTDLHTLYTQIGFETSNVPRVSAVMSALLTRLATAVPTASLICRSIVALAARGQMTENLRSALDRVSDGLSRWSGAEDAGTIDTPIGLLSEPSAPLTEPVAIRQLVCRRTQELVSVLVECHLLAAALNDRAAIAGVAELVSDNPPPALYRDQALALLTAAAATAATLVACLLWIETSWPEGFVAAQFAAICCSLFATFDHPSKIIGQAVAGILVALPVAALYAFAILPRIDGFASLALVLAPVLLLFSYLQTYERLEGLAVVLAVAFAGALALQESFVADFAAFLNSNLAEIVGPLIAAGMLLVFRTIDPIWNAQRILQSGRSMFGRLSRAGPRETQAWLLPMLDRAGQAATRLAGSPSVDQDVLRDIRVGLNLSALNRYRDGLGQDLRAQFAAAMASIGDSYARERITAPAALPAALAAELDRLREILIGEPASEGRTEGVAALAGLRQDLDSVAVTS